MANGIGTVWSDTCTLYHLDMIMTNLELFIGKYRVLYIRSQFINDFYKLSQDYHYAIKLF